MMLIDDAHDGVVHGDEPRVVKERRLARRFPRDEIARRGLRRSVGGDEWLAVVEKVRRTA